MVVEWPDINDITANHSILLVILGGGFAFGTRDGVLNLAELYKNDKKIVCVYGRGSLWINTEKFKSGLVQIIEKMQELSGGPKKIIFVGKSMGGCKLHRVSNKYFKDQLINSKLPNIDLFIGVDVSCSVDEHQWEPLNFYPNIEKLINFFQRKAKERQNGHPLEYFPIYEDSIENSAVNIDVNSDSFDIGAELKGVQIHDHPHCGGLSAFGYKTLYSLVDRNKHRIPSTYPPNPFYYHGAHYILGKFGPYKSGPYKTHRCFRGTRFHNYEEIDSFIQLRGEVIVEDSLEENICNNVGHMEIDNCPKLLRIIEKLIDRRIDQSVRDWHLKIEYYIELARTKKTLDNIVDVFYSNVEDTVGDGFMYLATKEIIKREGISNISFTLEDSWDFDRIKEGISSSFYYVRMKIKLLSLLEDVSIYTDEFSNIFDNIIEIQGGKIYATPIIQFQTRLKNIDQITTESPYFINPHSGVIHSRNCENKSHFNKMFECFNCLVLPIPGWDLTKFSQEDLKKIIANIYSTGSPEGIPKWTPHFLRKDHYLTVNAGEYLPHPRLKAYFDTHPRALKEYEKYNKRDIHLCSYCFKK